MKAKDLAKLLLQNPESEVSIPYYNGGSDPLHEITGVLFEKKGEKTSCRDGGFNIHKDGTTKSDTLILKVY